jgi:hypothetical protein
VQRTVLVLGVVAAAVACATAAAAPSVRVMVVGRTHLLLAPRSVTAAQALVRASGKRCAASAGTPLAALAAARRNSGPAFSVRDYGGSCSRNPRDGGSLFVFAVGPDRNRGRDGWAYKVGPRSGTAGAADPTGPFGRRLLQSGAQVTWFWCRLSRRGACQRSLGVLSAGRVPRGGRLRVAVRGYDDAGHSVSVRGARVRLGASSAVTGAGGSALVRAPRTAGRARLTATRPGMVRAFDRSVRVG